ncbi:hydroxyethylthiazole kinase [Sneathiella marina]|uniref:Hydroxyethylthiazole kinase n=1 Tax=Sneathiella marina TaxID=2950108 RepID=A0ABY4VZP1_9PROT|nr:hydroxyethylthiazole kinase [Sneathiella marina]USG60059.1 hydroxyethylthiazole kinase [Sneathiella marina]
MQQSIIESIWSDYEMICESRPLVHNITNLVVTNFSANALLALGASPLMSHAPEELEEIIGISNALVINIGTLDIQQIDSMKLAVGFANEKKIPIVIDPVGAGASALRTETALALIKNAHRSIVKGNGGEILALANQQIQSKGVDSLYDPSDAIPAAQSLISEFDVEAIAISGPEDVVVDATTCTIHANGSCMMPAITGMGCILTAITGAFSAVSETPYTAARNAVSLVSIAGEMAARKSQGPGSFLPHFLDQLYTIKQADLTGRLNVREAS